MHNNEDESRSSMTAALMRRGYSQVVLSDLALEELGDLHTRIIADHGMPLPHEEMVWGRTPDDDDILAELDALDNEVNVHNILDSRKSVYGDATEAMVNQAKIISGILGVEVHAWQVPLILMGIKLQRTSVTPDYADNSDDIEGYLELFRGVIGDDMVHARTAADYRAQKEGK